MERNPTLEEWKQMDLVDYLERNGWLRSDAERMKGLCDVEVQKANDQETVQADIFEVRE